MFSAKKSRSLNNNNNNNNNNNSFAESNFAVQSYFWMKEADRKRLGKKSHFNIFCNFLEKKMKKFRQFIRAE